MTAHTWFSHSGGTLSATLRQETMTGLEVLQQMAGIQPRRYVFSPAGSVSTAQPEADSRFVHIAYADQTERAFVHLHHPGFNEQIFRPFLPASDPACWQLVECWMIDNFCYNQQQHYHLSVLCRYQMQPVRTRSLLFGVLTAPLAIRCAAFLSAAQMGGDDE